MASPEPNAATAHFDSKRPGWFTRRVFNPFVGPVLEAVADNIRHSFAQDPRPMYIAYSTPQQVSPFGRGTPFRLVESDPDYEIYHLAREAPGTAQTR